MDAMSDAIEGSDVMLYGVSKHYKESANVRWQSIVLVHVPSSLHSLSLLSTCLHSADLRYLTSTVSLKSSWPQGNL